MDKRRIAIVAGGYSSEFPVSLRSAQGIYSFMDKDRYDIYIVKLTRDEWFVELPDGETSEIDKNDLKLSVKIVYDKDIMKNVYNAKTEAEIKKALLDKIKEINAQIPKYKAIRGMYITEEPLIKTTTNKIKRQDNLDAIK